MRSGSGGPLAIGLAAFLLVGCSSLRLSSEPETLVVVVPSRHDGHVGAVVVNQGGEKEVLDTAYAAARTGTGARVKRTALSVDDVGRIFADASAALPPRARSFTLYFVLGRGDLTPDSKRLLDDVLTDVASRAAAEVIVSGHTDRMGTDENNDALSLKRAQMMRDLVIRRGVKAELVHAVGLGEREPVVATDDGVAEARNRRVEITVR